MRDKYGKEKENCRGWYRREERKRQMRARKRRVSDTHRESQINPNAS